MNSYSGGYSRERKYYYEEYAYVLDYLSFGYGPGYTSSRQRPLRGPIAQAIGEDYFMLLELKPVSGTELVVGERVYLAKDLKGKLIRVSRRLIYDELTVAAKSQLPRIVEEAVAIKEPYFLDFFNSAHPLTTRMHSLELLHGIGKKTLWRILNERKRKPFESFEDLKTRAKIDPQKLVVDRIISELRDPQRHYLFARAASSREE